MATLPPELAALLGIIAGASPAPVVDPHAKEAFDKAVAARAEAEETYEVRLTAEEIKWIMRAMRKTVTSPKAQKARKLMLEIVGPGEAQFIDAHWQCMLNRLTPTIEAIKAKEEAVAEAMQEHAEKGREDA